jgi:hypothetical protein
MTTPGTTPEPLQSERSEWFEVVQKLGPIFADRVAAHDQEDSFVADNYADLKAHRFFSAGVPTELGVAARPSRSSARS